MASFLKQRLVGAIVLISLGIIFIPMLLTGRGDLTGEQPKSNVPPKPAYEIEAPVVLPMEDGGNRQPAMHPVKDEEPVAQAIDNDSSKDEAPQITTGAKTPAPSSASATDTATQEDSKQATAAPQAATAEQAIQPAGKPETTAGQEPPVEQAPEPEKPAAKEPAQVAKAEASIETAPKPVVSGWIVQLGSFAVEKNALQLRDKLRKNGHASFVETYQHESKTRYRVRVGPEQTRELADQLKTRLKQETQLNGLVMAFPE